MHSIHKKRLSGSACPPQPSQVAACTLPQVKDHTRFHRTTNPRPITVPHHTNHDAIRGFMILIFLAWAMSPPVAPQ